MHNTILWISGMNRISLGTETIERATRALEGINDIKGGDRFPININPELAWVKAESGKGRTSLRVQYT